MTDLTQPPDAPDPRLSAIGRRIRELRQAAGLGQLELAGRVGLSRSSIANIERGGQGSIGILLVLDLVDALGSAVQEIMPTSPMPWLDLARRIEAARTTYAQLAEQCWNVHDYLTAIRYRGIVEGLEMARTNQLSVTAEEAPHAG